MYKISRCISALGVIVLAAMSLSACGGGTSGDVVAQVGETSITKADLNHWMSTLAGGDFYEISSGHTVPAGLVSEPPNYAACVARLETIAASQMKEASKPTAAQLSSKCRQLYRALRLQTIEFLIGYHWLLGLYTEEGLTATDAETTQLLNHIKAEQFPKEELQKYLARKRRSLSDERFVVKLDVLRQKAQKKIEADSKRVLAKFTEAGQRWTAKTNCHAGYVVQHCRQYTGSPVAPSSLPSPAVLLEQVAVITGRPCINQPACG